MPTASRVDAALQQWSNRMQHSTPFQMPRTKPFRVSFPLFVPRNLKLVARPEMGELGDQLSKSPSKSIIRRETQADRNPERTKNSPNGNPSPLQTLRSSKASLPISFFKAFFPSCTILPTLTVSCLNRPLLASLGPRP